MYPYVPPQIHTADEIRMEQQLIDDDFIELPVKFDEVNDVATQQKKEQKITDLIDDVTDENNLIVLTNFGEKIFLTKMTRKKPLKFQKVF